MTILIIVCGVVFVALVFAACCKVSGDCARQEEQKDHCESCLRWPECNGVDEECPWRAVNG